MTHDEQIRKWKWAVVQMRKLIDLDAPDALKAQLLIQVLMPKMIEITNTEEYVGIYLSEMITHGICMRSGKCLKCKSAYQSDDVLNLCPKCSAEFDQWEADIMKDEPNEPI
jgi:hypothetical protein